MRIAPTIAIAALVLPTTLAAQQTAARQPIELAATEQLPADCFDVDAAAVARTLRAGAASILNAALDQKETTRASLTTAAARAADWLGQDSRVATMLRELGADHGNVEESDVDDIERAIERTVDNLEFEPMVEAPLPVGWPATAPIDEVVLKRYPKYRMATAPMRGSSETTPFWKLFNHIQSNDIAMTAPVQMDGDAGDGGRMAFLYRDEDTGPLQSGNGVEVIDVEPAFAVSIGARGYRNTKKVEALFAQIESWLAQNAGRFERSGPVRVMGYNSPMVPGNRRFFEVELPLRRKHVVALDSASASDANSK